MRGTRKTPKPRVPHHLTSSNSLQRIERARADFVDGAQAGNSPVLRRFQTARRVAIFGPRGVVLDQRLGLRNIHVQTLLDGFFLVVVALDQRFTRDVVDILTFGGLNLT